MAGEDFDGTHTTQSFALAKGKGHAQSINLVLILWSLWESRYEATHKGIHMQLNMSSIYGLTRQLMSLQHTRNANRCRAGQVLYSQACQIANRCRIVQWGLPKPWTLKLNAYGSTRSNQGSSGGGIIRKERGPIL
ncbi:hypothetical protein Leryth_023932 [Lithospermum erythrorhizon]|nr:hypothetical protein Leryth_023932 [Lithospermum erythrorhizon]